MSPFDSPQPRAVNNSQTVMFGGAMHRGGPGGLFDRVHPAMREQLQQVHRHGVMLFAASTDLGLVAHHWVEATDGLHAVTVGRHSAADLSLPWLESLSLRHLLLLVHRSSRSTLLRALDLRSGAGFSDEQGRPLLGLEANGPLVLGVSGWWLFAFPTGAAAPWSPSAPSPWATLPERRFTEVGARPQPSRALRETLVLGRSGPLPVGERSLLQPGEVAEGRLHLLCGGARSSVAVGKSALSRGVLLGRDPRCDGAGVLTHQAISRVHAVLLTDARGELCLLDVGSSNGVWTGAERGRVTHVEAGQRYGLANVATAVWELTH